MKEIADKAIEAYDVKTSGPDARAATLSGGNLQKIVLAREFAHDLKVLVAASPTQGLDVAAVETVHAHLVSAAERGVAVLLISEDLDEILELNDRILVMYEGRLSEVIDRTSHDEVGLRMAGETPGGEPRARSPASRGSMSLDAQAKASLVKASHPTILPLPSTAPNAARAQPIPPATNGRCGHPTRLPKVAAPVR